MNEPISATSAPAVTDAPATETPDTEQVTTETPVTTEQPDNPDSENGQAPSQPDPLAVLETLQLDPKVKEVLKAGFLRQADYTQKTQKLAEIQRAADAYQSWSPVISFLEKNPNITDSLFGITKDKPNQEEVEIPDDPKEFAKYVKEQAKKELREEMAKEQTVNSDIETASSLDPRLNTDEIFAQSIAGIIENNFGDAVRKGEMTVTEATKQALEKYKAWETGNRQNVVKEVTTQARKKTMVIPSGNGSPLATAPKTGKMSMREAADRAEEELHSR